ncbi:formate dehydrogenase accessory sulfurtransferase FdhD [Variovorax sp. PCZ-1]|uniref:formate dehydrogenase accessory sulfurtransferase FdhD n=1 Tax=Variovorax sp. PCZ-1 TaxID=2835533 RepID=UPI001BD09CB3|nr:formate dehydrogenase accessory sulfurtransferase FdhD [Variovorax sp. PCZ-1]MBS7807581.1 formate dehydrogenase accessory sulfurtransferase FdhD [Variovorax sp. PCZ-1]
MATLSILPQLTQARAPLTREVLVINEKGEKSTMQIPAERDLTVYVDKRELVTLMTLGAQPELLVLGFLLNQRLVDNASQIESITVDWEVNSAAVKTHAGIDKIEERTAKKVVTTGCGQGSVFGGLMDEIENIKLPAALLTKAQLYGITEAIRQQESTYKSAGSVHGCALFKGTQMLMFVEDVGRHNAIDTLAGWMAMQGLSTKQQPQEHEPYVFYTTGRLTSEMVIKSAQMGIAIVISRSGITQMGYDIAQQLGLCAIGRAVNKHFVAYTAFQRFEMQLAG